MPKACHYYSKTNIRIKKCRRHDIINELYNLKTEKAAFPAAFSVLQPNGFYDLFGFISRDCYLKKYQKRVRAKAIVAYFYYRLLPEHKTISKYNYFLKKK
jgi:hypothetical protein